MSEYVNEVDSGRSWFKDKILLQDRVAEYVKGSITPFNVVAALIILTGFSLVVLRFVTGLGAVTNSSQDQPWGLFLSWGLFSGVPMSAAGFVLGTAVYIFGLREYHPVVKNAVLIGLLGYLFAVVFLLIDLGRPWRLPYPMIGNFGTASVLFLVAWHVALYLTCQFLEFFPSILEWGGWRALRKRAGQIIVGLTILGVLLSTLHQSALGAMFLLAPGKLHPLWYTPYLPELFFVSAIAAGICMVIFVSQMTRYFFKTQGDGEYFGSLDRITLGLGKAAAFVLITYFGLKIAALAHSNEWALLGTPFGYWFLVELLVFVGLPCAFFVLAVSRKSVTLVRFTAIFTIIGIIVNRFNVSMVALNWQLPNREFFNWAELLIVISVIMLEIVVYRWIVNRMPVLRRMPGEVEQ